MSLDYSVMVLELISRTVQELTELGVHQVSPYSRATSSKRARTSYTLLISFYFSSLASAVRKMCLVRLACPVRVESALL